MKIEEKRINNFKDYLSARDFTNYEPGADDEDEFGNFTNPEPEEEEIKRFPIMGDKGSPFKWPKDTYSPEDDEEGSDNSVELERLRKTIMRYQKPKERDLPERPKMKPTNEGIRDKMTPKSEEDILSALQYTKSKEKEKTFVIACENGDLGKVKLIMKSGVDIHYNSDEALRLAAGDGEYEVTKFLLQNGANVDELINDPIYYKFAKRFVSIRELIEDYKNK